ncbi:MAG: cytochrome c [Pseudomonadota bacterium]
MGKFNIPRTLTVLLTIAAIYGLIKWVIPAASREITALPFPLPVPGTLVFFYMVLTLVAMFMLVTFSDRNIDEFMGPIWRFMRGDFGKAPRLAALVAIPLLVGWQVYDAKQPKVELPSSLRIQHPSSNFPQKFEEMKNPFASPTDDEIQAFLEQAESGEVEFIEQVQGDFDVWVDEFDENPLAAIATAPMQKFLADLDAGNVSPEIAKAALVEKNLFEGRALYAMNCRPCHGDSVAGDGPMADGFKLRPINFTDNGTIETIVEGYTFWRVANGGPGLPTEATPWDSAMPEWKLNLTDEQRWKIIMAEYDMAEKTPRIPESH